jgi:hypothetical protein
MITKLSENYEDTREQFCKTEFASSVAAIIKANADIFAALDNIVIMGLGSPPNLWQLAFAKFISFSLTAMNPTDRIVPILVQDPCFESVDRKFLELHGVQILQYVDRQYDDRPLGHYDIEDSHFEWERSNIQPAVSHITEKTLFFAPNLPWVVIARVLKATNPAIYIGGSMEQLVHSNEWLAKTARKNGVLAFEEQYRSNIEAGRNFAGAHVWMALPVFDHHWDVREEGRDDVYGDLGHFVVYKRKGDGSCEGWHEGPVRRQKYVQDEHRDEMAGDSNHVEKK